jgi:AraC family transcriptional regulator
MINKKSYDKYISKINKVQDYIEQNLSENFSLMQLSEIAGFSPYHFHRIFFSITGETLFQFIQRLRLEKAAFLILSDPKIPIMNISIELGFSNQASFAKSFKKHYGINASEMKKNGLNFKNSNKGKVLDEVVCYNRKMRSRQYNKKVDSNIFDNIKIKKISDMNVIYIRHTGKYVEDSKLFENLFKKLAILAAKKNLSYSSETKFLTSFHDFKGLTDEKKLRISVCMSIKNVSKIDTYEDSEKMIIPGGIYAVGRFEISSNDYQFAWNKMFSEWLPSSGYQPDDRLCFEMYHDTTSEIHIVDLFLPVKPLY